MGSHLPALKANGKAKISAYIQETARSGNFPAIFAGVTNAKETIYFDQAGDRVLGQPDKGQIQEDTPTEMYSQTKLVTSVAAMQLVEQRLVSLDSTEDIEKWLPELGTLPLIEGYKDNDTPILRQPKNKATLRMLLSHTAGCTYSHSDPLVQKYLEKNPVPGMFAPDASIKTLMVPFVFEPGTSFAYSHSIDWAGILVERISKLRLEDYFQKHIFAPCGITTMSFYPGTDLADRKMFVCNRSEDGKLSVTQNGFGFGRPTDDAVVRKQELQAGGAGLFGTQADYLRFLRGILRSDPKHAGDGGPAGLLKPESYAELFKPSMPSPDQSNACAKIAEMVSRAKYFDPPTPSPEMVQHSVGMMINTQDFKGRRKAFSGCWSGAAKTQFWIDPTTGIAAVFGTQLFSAVPGDPWGPEYARYESMVYDALE